MTITETVAQALNIGGIVILTLFVFAGAAIGFILLWGRPREEDVKEPVRPNRKLTQAEKTAKWLERNQAIRRVK